VVRLGATCKQLFMLTKEEAIWRPLVKQTFGMAALMYQRIAAERAEEKAGVEASGAEASEEVRGREDDDPVQLVHKFDDLFTRLPSVSTARSWKDVFMTEDFWRKEVDLQGRDALEENGVFRVWDNYPEGLGIHSNLEGSLQFRGGVKMGRKALAWRKALL